MVNFILILLKVKHLNCIICNNYLMSYYSSTESKV